MSAAFSPLCIHSFRAFWYSPVKSFSCDRKQFTRRGNVGLIGTGELGNIPEHILASEVRTRCQVVFDNEQSLHLWKIHPCTSTVWRQLTDWREQVTTWRDLRGLLYSHRDTVCVLIQSNCIKLQPSVNVLMWTARLFSHHVYLRTSDLNPLSLRACVCMCVCVCCYVIFIIS
jgi:hypothetical protein